MLPLIRYELQPGMGVAVMKQNLCDAGIIASAPCVIRRAPSTPSTSPRSATLRSSLDLLAFRWDGRARDDIAVGAARRGPGGGPRVLAIMLVAAGASADHRGGHGPASACSPWRSSGGWPRRFRWPFTTLAMLGIGVGIGALTVNGAFAHSSSWVLWFVLARSAWCQRPRGHRRQYAIRACVPRSALGPRPSAPVHARCSWRRPR